MQAEGERRQPPLPAFIQESGIHLQQPLKKEIDSLQKQQIIVPMDVDETSDLCNSLFWYKRLMAMCS